MTATHTVLYVAPSVDAAADAVAALERAADGLDVDATDSAAVVRERAPTVDCVVYEEPAHDGAGETRPTRATVVDACAAPPVGGERTPIVLRAATTDPAAARRLEGIDGYVRRTDDPSEWTHLATQIEWACGADGGANDDPRDAGAEPIEERGATLEREHERLTALFENVPAPTVRYQFVDDDPIVRDVNDRFEAVFGYDRDDVVGENVDDYIVPPDLESDAARLNEKLLSGEPIQAVGRRRTADGDRDFVIDVVPVEVGERSLEGFSIYTDITEQKRRERELVAQNERLDEFATIVGHDLRNPLSVARGYLEVAEETGDPAAFREIEAAHDRMSGLLEKLLALAREGAVIDDPEPLSLHEAANRAWNAVEIDTRPTPALELEDDAVLEADRDRLLEVLENLIRNAVEHGNGNESEIDEAITVRIGATETGFFVADDGAGIPEADRSAVFDSGYTTAENGTGFGLAIVEGIADAHGWTVTVSASRDGGARFEFDGSRADETQPELANVDGPEPPRGDR
ncbi:nitrogen regulation protein NR(II) [Natrialbaceae archaeon GCM10025810]|uniref:two-component system sensor histidine kinase NtrB n=1 Tax=Halovalidus salilacus TaxID=3075124 RepID=UPI00360B6880